MAGLQQLNWASEGVGATAAALVDLSTVAGNKISNPPWVKFQSAGWVNFPSAPTLYRLKDVGLYVTLFAVGHSITLLFGVLSNISISSYVIDAIIGFSVVYKALDNLGAFQRWFGYQPDTRLATLIFGLLHGFGLATKIQEFEISPDGLIANLIAFNVGVEIGQLLALGGILILMGYWRRTASFWRHAYTANVAMMSAGFLLMGYQITGLIVSQ
ncbi:HupE/UreJ family protein [Pseudomonas aeruginosa]|uniref:HupE/UreJ family protein n=1 Tax=Pseudomonas aeruginosa TaxID=287 RepID=UPI001F0806F1|nr:HupE/UreJ family protein [Pseudomonas aeruginosa]